MGLYNPLGPAFRVSLIYNHQRFIERWQQKAKEIVDRLPPEDLNPNISAEVHPQTLTSFKKELSTWIQQPTIETCELTIYAIGTVFVRMDHANAIPTAFLYGFYKCYEYAAYDIEISNELHEIALQAAERVIRIPDEKFQSLSKRPSPEEGISSEGYPESLLFTSFTCVGLCIDATDNIDEICSRLQVFDEVEKLSFFGIGVLHFGWATCVLEPETRTRSATAALSSIARMLHCIHIAHVFLGTCEAFEKLFQQEMITQINNYVRDSPSHTDARYMNKLRTLALAVVNLTHYSRISVADEDQKYFTAWERYAKLSERHRRIEEQCEVLYNIQEAETRREEARRAWWLSRIVLFLTASTFISVAADSYNFIIKPVESSEY